MCKNPEKKKPMEGQEDYCWGYNMALKDVEAREKQSSGEWEEEFDEKTLEWTRISCDGTSTHEYVKWNEVKQFIHKISPDKPSKRLSADQIHKIMLDKWSISCGNTKEERFLFVAQAIFDADNKLIGGE